MRRGAQTVTDECQTGTGDRTETCDKVQYSWTPSCAPKMTEIWLIIGDPPPL